MPGHLPEASLPPPKSEHGGETPARFLSKIAGQWHCVQKRNVFILNFLQIFCKEKRSYTILT
jgi:hypothetical protein